ncbi:MULTISPECIES: hypothetical protein [unclassified Shinella]|uniref:hypothetical protein n=1 Tax=unclassified Shinella TaxID=2643062 RepID=UPI00225D0931|nr:Rho_N domain-containing protein [Rhizobiaceae bacterium]CAK7259100.1 Rho termination factor N-terminal domain-containing protein [Shinella sp. WSC3-e]
MQTANVMLAIGGDAKNTVPKYGVTAAEVAVLRYIHGEDAVFDIEVKGSVERTHRQEIGRLTEVYGRQEGERRVSPAVADLYPGAAARVFETFDELELPDELYAAAGRKVAAPAKTKKETAAPVADDDGLDAMKVKELQALAGAEGVDLTGVTKKDDIVEAIRLHRAQPAQPAQPEDEGADDGDAEDGVGEMNDEFSGENNLFK